MRKGDKQGIYTCLPRRGLRFTPVYIYASRVQRVNNAVFGLSVVRLQYKHKMAIERRKYVVKKTAEERKLFLRRKITSIGTASTKFLSSVLRE